MKLKQIFNVTRGYITIFDTKRVCVGSMVMDYEKPTNPKDSYCFNDQDKACSYSYWLKPFENCEVVSIRDIKDFTIPEMGDYFTECLDDGLVITIEVTEKAEQNFIKKVGRRRMNADDWANYYNIPETKLDDDLILKYGVEENK